MSWGTLASSFILIFDNTEFFFHKIQIWIQLRLLRLNLTEMLGVSDLWEKLSLVHESLVSLIHALKDKPNFEISVNVFQKYIL